MVPRLLGSVENHRAIWRLGHRTRLSRWWRPEEREDLPLLINQEDHPVIQQVGRSDGLPLLGLLQGRQGIILDARFVRHIRKNAFTRFMSAGGLSAVGYNFTMGRVSHSQISLWFAV